MKPIKTVIVEDEPLARKRLKRQLAAHADIELVGEAANGSEGVDLIADCSPDLVFLDVHMPDMDGFAMLSLLDEAPFVIFVTAYDRYALKAFDVHAVDYLLKPYDNERFAEALARARLQIQAHTRAYQQKLEGLIQGYQATRAAYLTHFRLKKNGRLLEIPTNEVAFLESSGNYLTLHTGEGEELYRGTMNAVQTQLDPKRFLRIHRSYLVNVAAITRVRYLNNSEYRFVFADGRALTSGRSFKNKIMHFLSETDLV